MSQATYFGTGGILPGTFVQTLTGNSGGAVPPTAGGTINVIGSGSVNVVGNPGTNTLTISLTGEGVVWSIITANQTAAVNNGYFCNKASALSLALPTTSALGDVIEVNNINTALGILITQAAGQQIFIGNTNTTSGATGTLQSSALGDSLKLVCSTANLTWRVVSMIGNWTFV